MGSLKCFPNYNKLAEFVKWLFCNSLISIVSKRFSQCNYFSINPIKSLYPNAYR
jgi:hypothetical protein